MFKKIAIIGVGLIGGSIGKAARRKRLAKEVWGLSRHIESIKRAKRLGAVDKIARNIKEAVDDADLIIVAAPPAKVAHLIKESVGYAKRGAIFIDAASTKQSILNAVSKIIPSDMYFVGTHPMAGSHLAGVDFSDERLFIGSICFLIKTRKTNKTAFNKIKRFWNRLGASTVEISAQEHDRIVARISHLPHIISFALINSADRGSIKFAAGGFKSMTRLAKSEPHMWADIMQTNTVEILKGIASFERYLNTLKSYIKNNKYAAIFREFEKAGVLRGRIADNNDYSY